MDVEVETTGALVITVSPQGTTNRLIDMYAKNL
jgi:hypothetical protein